MDLRNVGLERFGEDDKGNVVVTLIRVRENDSRAEKGTY